MGDEDKRQGIIDALKMKEGIDLEYELQSRDRYELDRMRNQFHDIMTQAEVRAEGRWRTQLHEQGATIDKLNAHVKELTGKLETSQKAAESAEKAYTEKIRQLTAEVERLQKVGDFASAMSAMRHGAGPLKINLREDGMGELHYNGQKYMVHLGNFQINMQHDHYGMERVDFKVELVGRQDFAAHGLDIDLGIEPYPIDYAEKDQLTDFEKELKKL